MNARHYSAGSDCFMLSNLVPREMAEYSELRIEVIVQVKESSKVM